MAIAAKQTFFFICGALLLGAFFVPAVVFAQTYGGGNYGSNEYGGTSNTPPAVSITAPLTGASYDKGDTVTITASSSDSDGTIVQVEFFVDNTSIGTSSSPYSAQWEASSSGTHTIAAVATDNESGQATSTISITVSSGGGNGKNDTSDEEEEEKLQDLAAQVKELIAMIAALTNPGAAEVTSEFVFLTDLELGSVNEDVRRLQQFLNGQGFTLNAAPGSAGAPSFETNYFGELTKEALSRFQAFHTISPAVGYFGPVTRALVNLLLQ